MNELDNYTDYYVRPIQRQTNGFKPVLGGTGIGKTSPIPDVVAAAVTDRKFIYVPNRVQLLNEMATRLRKQGVKFVHLQRDVDIVIQLLQSPELRASFDELLLSPLVTKPLSRIQQGSLGRQPDVASVRRACDQVHRFLALSHFDGVADLLEDQARIVLHFFQRILREAGQGGSPTNRPRDHQRLTAHPVIRHLFPYIAFRESDDTPILLVTLQKLFHGFFDGLKMVNLSQLKGADGNYIIFLDEFDFLESNLIELICADAEIEAPFKFVEAFYRAMKWHKLPLADYPATEKAIRMRIEQIVADIDEQRNEGLDFPNINQFTCSDPTLKGQAIFQTNRTVTNRTLYLRQTDRSFAVVPRDTGQDQERVLPAFRLFRFVTATTRRILYLFKDLEIQHPTLYREMLRHCFENTDFAIQIGRIRQFPQRQHSQSTQFDQLLDGGYSLYEIHDLQQTSDQEEVAFRHFAISTTPEKLLLSLATHNLVFGLSATTDIPRCVRSFSDEWLRRQEGLNYIEVDERDLAIIERRNHAKQALRNNQIHVVQADELNTDNPVQRRLLQFIDGIADDPEFGQDDTGGYRKRRVARFFATLLWIGQQAANVREAPDTHLMFFNSFRQILHVFKRHPAPDDQLFAINALPDATNSVFDAYELHFAGAAYIVLFYNAERGQYINSSTEAKRKYHALFWQGKPVIVVTTYPSAGNGVNLQYYPSPAAEAADNETDFTHVHLLESPYYYFGQVGDEHTAAEQTAIIKQNFWYLAKLFEGKLLSDASFRRYLANIRYPGLSREYRTNISTARDAVLNQVATYIQALGRVERVWAPMPDQAMRFSREVYEDLAIFCTESAYADVFDRRGSLNSHNLQRVWEQIRTAIQGQIPIVARTKDERLAAINAQCRAALEELLARLARVRAGHDDAAAKADWHALREAVLRLDIHAPVLRQYACLFQTSYVQHGTLFIDDDFTLYRPDAAPPGCRQWRLDHVYYRLRSNSVIRQFFAQRGYELGVTTLAQTFLTPYCYQAILTGALGEAAIHALLQHEGIALETPPDPLFEVADYKIASQPCYIDVKYYSERTLDAFQLTPNDPEWLPKLNEEDFRLHARRKLDLIQAHHYANAAACKLIYLNLSSTNERVSRYADATFTLVETLEDAQIIVIQGVLDSQRPDTYTDVFRSFLDDLRRLRAHA